MISSPVDLFTDEVLLDPYPHLRALRDAGPVVWLEAHDVHAVTRYAEARAVLADDATFVSGQGVGLNDFINQGGRGTTLMSDGAEHATQREIIGRPLTPRALAELRPEAQARADALVDGLVERGTFDAVPDLAQVLPATWVPDLLGRPRALRRHPGQRRPPRLRPRRARLRRDGPGPAGGHRPRRPRRRRCPPPPLTPNSVGSVTPGGHGSHRVRGSGWGTTGGPASGAGPLGRRAGRPGAGTTERLRPGLGISCG
ncbi:MAG TPA: hypothetical protein VFU19_14070 [Iamia sp.]|nr:hypothetical protein [Iamia sp.]